MVDRLEELLALLEDEDGGEEREDGLDPVAAVPPAIPTAEAGTDETPELEENEGPAAEAAEWLPEDLEIPPERREGSEEAAAKNVLAEPDWSGLARPQNGDWQWNLPQTGSVRDQAGDGKEESAAEAAERGLEGLYRETVRAARPAAQPLPQPVEQAGKVHRAVEPGRTAELTVDELDRAVRRDSRRYDGGMTLF